MNHEVKGSFFVTARGFLERDFPERQQELADELPPEVRATFDDPIASGWYPETHLQEMLRAMYRTLANKDDARFRELMEGSVRMGIHRFFSAVLGLAHPGFVLRRVPVLWRLLRRGPARVVVETHPEGTLVRYQDFPFFDDHVYSVLTTTSIGTLLQLTGEAQAPRIVHHTSTHLDILGVHR